MENLLIPREVVESFDKARRSGNGARFAAGLLDSLEIRFHIDDRDLARIPAHGSAILVANHPYGILEGLILTIVLSGVRPDFKIVANSWLRSIPELRDQLILVNPFETAAAHAENRAPLRAALRWLAGGGMAAVFPAGEVAHVDWKEQSVTDSTWKTSAARMALRTRCAVIPAFFEGANSMPFQIAGMLHPGFRTVGLAREFARLSGKTIRLHIGSPIPHTTLERYRSAAEATAYVRHRTFILASRSQCVPQPICSRLPQAATSSVAEPCLYDEVAALPPECELANDRNFSVYLADSRQIPALLQEIGRCREVAFRSVGEGTGKQIDLDQFDEYYRHLFLWHRAERRLAGAYRLATTSDVLPRYGIAGLYTSTLFRFDRAFFDRVGPAVELGRSFVVQEYQKNYAALLLLWKGISRLVLRRPEAPILFGAVSISPDYSPVSRSLMASYLRERAGHELALFVTPRAKFRGRLRRNSLVERLVATACDIEDLSLSISDIEADGKGIPVLIRQYLKTGGRVLAFNVDAKFSNALDALMLADLRMAPAALLERCMGRAEAHAFLAAHNSSACPTH
ncbi:MAG TPA: GNAT family N-acyltransferase [Bryobacteraceae bacterium]|nr:GNAT family N-acyltransferase [Bryobacteraceae bacterium]